MWDSGIHVNETAIGIMGVTSHVSCFGWVRGNAGMHALGQTESSACESLKLVSS